MAEEEAVAMCFGPWLEDVCSPVVGGGRDASFPGSKPQVKKRRPELKHLYNYSTRAWRQGSAENWWVVGIFGEPIVVTETTSVAIT